MEENFMDFSLRRIVVLIILLLVILISIVILIGNLTTNNEIVDDNIIIDETNIDIYKVQENIVMDHTIFFNLQIIISDTITDLMNKDYNNIYDQLSPNLKEKYTKKEFQIEAERFVKDSFTDFEIFYGEIGHLEYAYETSNDEYICIFTTKEKGNLEVIIDLKDSTYMIDYIKGL